MNLTGSLFDYLNAYLGGVLVSFTPCVYPILPLTIGFIAGANIKGTKASGFILSLIYVLGMALTYCVLAVAASLSGKIFGQFQNHPVVFLIVANVLIFFSLVMFDVISLPNWGVQVQSKVKPRNVWSVLLFGMASGLVVGPCTAPILGTLLLYVASKQNIFHGASLLFVFSFGVGTSLILAGTFSGFLSRLPKSGVWLLRVKQLAGLILLIAAEFYLIKAGKLFY